MAVGTDTAATTTATAARRRRFAWLRIELGLLWLTDGLFKWQPTVRAQFVTLVQSSAQSEPGPLHALVQGASQLVGHAPGLAAGSVGLGEIVLGTLLILGAWRHLAVVGSIVLATLIYVFGEGLGGVFSGSATDIGTAPLYALLTVAVAVGEGWTDLQLGRDRWRRAAAG